MESPSHSTPVEAEQQQQDGSEHQTSFWVVRVPEAVFSTDPQDSLRSEFEAVFKTYGDDVEFCYLRSFGRVKVSYPTLEQAELARSNLNNHEFQGTNIKTKPVKPIILGSQTLEIPQRTKQFLISPPASPPVGWEPVSEESPCVDYSLVTALASLQLPGEVHELHEATVETPGIFVVTPEDTEHDLTPSVLKNRSQLDQQSSSSAAISTAPSALVHTARPPLPTDS